MKKNIVLAELLNCCSHCHCTLKRPRNLHGSERRLGIRGLTKYNLCYAAAERKMLLTLMLQHFSEFLILLVSAYVGE